MYTLYKNITSLCAEKGIKPGKMCVETGMSKSIMTGLKDGTKKSISSDTAQKIADYFNVPVDYVLNGRPDSSSEQQKNPPTNEVDGIDESLLDDLVKLNPGDVEKVRAYIQGMLDKSEA